MLALTAICTNAQTWTDVTQHFITNPNFKNGSTNGWYFYTSPSRRVDGAIGFTPNNFLYFYQTCEGLGKGHYRLTIEGFYRDGTANSDWQKHLNTSYKGNSKAIYSFYCDGTSREITMPCISSSAQSEKVDANDVLVGNSKYVPSTIDGAANWFKKGFYTTSIEFDSSEDGYMYIQPICQTYDGAGWLVFGGVKLEYKGNITPINSIKFEQAEMKIAPGQSSYINYSSSPGNATVRKFTWSSSNTKVAKVDQYGEVTGVSAGVATITIKSVDGGNASASYKVNVVNPVIANSSNMKISEVAVSNLDMIIDPSGNYGSWMVLSNPTNDIVKLSGLYVTDDKQDLTKCAIKCEPNIIPVQGNTHLWFDHYDAVFAPSQINFKLNNDGGTVYVTNGKAVIDSVAYPKSVARTSYVRTALDSDKWVYCSDPIARYNDESFSMLENGIQIDSPVFSENGGFFTGTKDISINIPEGATLVVTFNGSTPTMSNGSKYNKSISYTLDNSYVIRARVYKDGYLPSDVVTRSYLLKDKNYVFPVISLATDPYNIYGNEWGIFTEGNNNGRPGNGKSYNCNWNADWDRPVNFEYITDKGEYALNQEVDMSACGGWSRAWTPHSFKLKANKYFMGLNTLNHRFFDNKPYNRHKVLQIRNGGNDNKYRFKDPALQEVIRRSGINVNTQSWQPVHVFINGAYQTVLNMREPNNKHYAYSNYGYDTDELDQFEMSPDSGYVQKEGTPDKYNEWYDLSSNAADSLTYSEICKLVDVDEFINYMAIELFLANNDWPQNNVKAFRSRNDGKFHFVLFDLDQAGDVKSSPFDEFARKKTRIFDYLYGDYRTPWKTGDRVTQEIKLVTIFLNMLNNDKFRKQFIDVFCLVSGSVFHPNNVNPIIDEMMNYMNKGMKLTNESCTISHDELKGALTTTNNNKKIEYLKQFKNMQINTRSIVSTLSCNIPEAEIYVNNIKVPFNYLSGTLIGPVTIRTSAPKGYKFLGWSRAEGLEIKETDFEIEVTGVSVRLYANWVKMTEEEMIAQNQLTAPVVINEVSATNDIHVSDYYKKSDWIELYNVSDEDINIAGMYLSDNINKPTKYQIPTDNPNINTIIPSHGYKVIWCDKKESITSDIHADFKLDGEQGTVMLSKYDNENILYSDTLEYLSHSGTESFGRYPDAGITLYTMQKPTPGSKNVCYGDIFEYMTPDKFYTGISNIACSDEINDIIISYVGNGIVNIKSDNTIKNVSVTSISGSVVNNTDYNDTFITLNLSAVSKGTYIVKAVDSLGKTNVRKIIIK